MMAYTYDQILAVDPANPANIARTASITIFAPGDTAQTPLTLTTTAGQPLANPLTTNVNGYASAFMHATLDRVAWAGGGFTGFLTSYEGIKNEAVTARTAADTSAAKAAVSASLVNAPADTTMQGLINNTASATRGALNATYVTKASAALQKIGDGADPNAVTTQDVKLLVTANRTNPDKVIEQHLVGYSFYSGTPQAGVGTLQGGSCESAVFANGTADWGTALGFEGIARADGDNAARRIATAIGNQGTAVTKGSVSVDLLVALRASGPKTDGGTGTVTESRSLDILEPTVGTTRRALYGVGAHRFRKGTAANTVEVANSNNVLQWSFSDALLRGFASDGSSVRVTIDTADTPAAARFNSELFGSGKHVSLKNNSGEILWVNADGTLITAGTIKAKTVATASRPSAATAGVGSQMYDSTLSKPIWSDGTVWRDAMGTAV